MPLRVTRTIYQPRYTDAIRDGHIPMGQRPCQGSATGSGSSLLGPSLLHRKAMPGPAVLQKIIPRQRQCLAHAALWPPAPPRASRLGLPAPAARGAPRAGASTTVAHRLTAGARGPPPPPWGARAAARLASAGRVADTGEVGSGGLKGRGYDGQRGRGGVRRGTGEARERLNPSRVVVKLTSGSCSPSGTVAAGRTNRGPLIPPDCIRCRCPAPATRHSRHPRPSPSRPPRGGSRRPPPRICRCRPFRRRCLCCCGVSQACLWVRSSAPSQRAPRAPPDLGRGSPGWRAVAGGRWARGVVGLRCVCVCVCVCDAVVG